MVRKIVSEKAKFLYFSMLAAMQFGISCLLSFSKNIKIKIHIKL
jgi:hypothetical protein